MRITKNHQELPYFYISARKSPRVFTCVLHMCVTRGSSCLAVGRTIILVKNYFLSATRAFIDTRTCVNRGGAQCHLVVLQLQPPISGKTHVSMPLPNRLRIAKDAGKPVG
jgi:hypothetical protein